MARSLIALALLLASVAPAVAHEPAPADWWADVAHEIYGFEFALTGRVRVDYLIDGVPHHSVYETAIGVPSQNPAPRESFNAFCNVNSRERWYFRFAASTTEERHGIRYGPFQRDRDCLDVVAGTVRGGRTMTADQRTRVIETTLCPLAVRTYAEFGIAATCREWEE